MHASIDGAMVRPISLLSIFAPQAMEYRSLGLEVLWYVVSSMLGQSSGAVPEVERGVAKAEEVFVGDEEEVGV